MTTEPTPPRDGAFEADADDEVEYGPEWLNTVAERLFEGDNLKDVLETVRKVSGRRSRLDLERLRGQLRVIRFQSWLRFTIVFLAMILFAGAALLYQHDLEVARLLIVSFVSFLGGAVAGSVGSWLSGYGGRGGKS